MQSGWFRFDWVTRPPLPAPTSADAVFDLIQLGTVLIVPLANGEPRTVLDAVEAGADRLDGVTVHQMHALHERPLPRRRATGDRLDHVSYFLSPVTRPHFAGRHTRPRPGHFSEVPALLADRRPELVVAAGSPPDRHGYFSLGTNADYVAPFIGRVPFFVEANAQMPRTFGRNQIHLSPGRRVVRGGLPARRGAARRARPTSTVRIAAFDRRADPQRGDASRPASAAIPNAVLDSLARPPRPRHPHRAALRRHHRPGRAGRRHRHPQAAPPGPRWSPPSPSAPNASTTSCTRTRPSNCCPCDLVNDPRFIGGERQLRLDQRHPEVDLLGQCASETIGGQLLVGLAAARPTSPEAPCTAAAARASSCCRSTATPRRAVSAGSSPSSPPGSVVTTSKNTVDHVVTEYGVAELRGRSTPRPDQVAHRHRPPRLPRRSPPTGRRAGFHLGPCSPRCRSVALPAPQKIEGLEAGLRRLLETEVELAHGGTARRTGDHRRQRHQTVVCLVASSPQEVGPTSDLAQDRPLGSLHRVSPRRRARRSPRRASWRPRRA